MNDVIPKHRLINQHSLSTGGSDYEITIDKGIITEMIVDERKR